jgi:hypothetical protein
MGDKMKEDITIKASDCINLDKNDKNETMIGKSIFIPQYGINMDDFHKYLDVKGLNATTNIEDLCIDWDDKYADELGALCYRT